MKKLTRKQRAKIYLRVAEYVFNHRYAIGLCEAIYNLYPDLDTTTASMEKAALNTLPEFSLFNPNTALPFWWDSDEKEARITCMLLCYEMIKNPIE